jgi:hypothetical protein
MRSPLATEMIIVSSLKECHGNMRFNHGSQQSANPAKLVDPASGCIQKCLIDGK